MTSVEARGTAEGRTDASWLVEKLLDARLQEARAGNRRGLFARLDDLLSSIDDIEGRPQLHEILPDRLERPTVHLSGITLRNWKSFERADLFLPHRDRDGSIVIVNGQNGFGKSSLLEAIVFCLFGQRAVDEVGFLLNAATGNRGARRRSYANLIERSLHRSKRALLDGFSAVSLSFESSAGRLEVERKWYFDDAGRLIADDEELLLREGEDRHLIETPEEVEPRAWYQMEIETRLLPANLAPFFMFDGEQVDRWAERRLSDQVQVAVSRILGLSDLASLAEDLRAYARDRDRRTDLGDVATIDALEQDMRTAQASITELAGALAAVEERIAVLHEQRDTLLSTLGDGPGLSHADLQQLLEAEHRLAAESARAERDLIGAIADRGPLALMGATLLKDVHRALAHEEEIERLSGLDPLAFEPYWERVVHALNADAVSIDMVRLRKSLHDAWAGPGGDTHVIHTHLTRSARAGAIALTQHAGATERAYVRAARDDARTARARAEAAKLARLAATRGEDARAKMQSALAALMPELEALGKTRAELGDALRARVAALAPLEQDHAQALEALRGAAPRARAIATATVVAGLLDDGMREAAERQYDRFAEAVTRNYRQLAHKDQIRSIHIHADGAVELIGEDGEDVTDYRLSAGENQLFAMALIAAVGDLVGAGLPLFVDTPLSRLDTAHRGSVLRLLATRTGQTVLMTQPEEMTERHLDTVRPMLAGVIELDHHRDARSGVGVSGFRSSAA